MVSPDIVRVKGYYNEVLWPSSCDVTADVQCPRTREKEKLRVPAIKCCHEAWVARSAHRIREREKERD